MSIFVFSIKSIIRKQFLYYLYFIILGSLFHTSILIMIPVYFLPFDKLYKRNIWIIIFILTFLFGSSNIILDIIDVIGKYTIFKSENIFSLFINYFQSEKIIFREIEYGLGFYFKVLINFMIILIADKVIKRDQNTTPYFILFFLGSIVFNVSNEIQLLGRVNNYFIILRPLILSILVWHFWDFKKYRLSISIFCLAYFILFLVSIYNSSNMCSPYQILF